MAAAAARALCLTTGIGRERRSNSLSLEEGSRAKVDCKAAGGRAEGAGVLTWRSEATTRRSNFGMSVPGSVRFESCFAARQISTLTLLRSYCCSHSPGARVKSGAESSTAAPSPTPAPAPAPASVVNNAPSKIGNRSPGSSPYPASVSPPPPQNITRHESQVSQRDREQILNQRGCIVWFTGLSGSGKSTLAYTLDLALTSRGKLSYVLDGDNVRHGLNKNLGFSRADREENIRRIGEVAKLFVDAGVITMVSFISPYREDRDRCRAMFPVGDFIEVYMKVPLSVCEKNDAKGLYKLARSGQLKGFTGIDDPYECPLNPEITVEVRDEWQTATPPEEMAKQIVLFLEERGFLTADN